MSAQKTGAGLRPGLDSRGGRHHMGRVGRVPRSRWSSGGNGTSYNFADSNCATSFARPDGQQYPSPHETLAKPGAKS